MTLRTLSLTHKHFPEAVIIISLRELFSNAQIYNLLTDSPMRKKCTGTNCSTSFPAEISLETVETATVDSSLVLVMVDVDRSKITAVQSQNSYIRWGWEWRLSNSNNIQFQTLRSVNSSHPARFHHKLEFFRGKSVTKTVTYFLRRTRLLSIAKNPRKHFHFIFTLLLKTTLYCW